MKRFLAPLLLSIVVLILAITNFQSGTFLTGWDNLHPEFNFKVNILRSIFAVWQEYQGTGLLGGMGHASDLLRQLFLWVLSLAIPLNQLRYVWTMLTLLIGSIGAYYLTRYVVKNHEHNNRFAFLGGLFYLLNLATIQTYYAPFEVFTAHFASLPWLFLTLLMYLKKPCPKTLAVFGLTLLLSTPGAYVPTLFVVFATCAGIISLLQLSWHKSNIKSSILRLIAIFSVIVLVNSFWLFPFAQFTLTKSSVNVNSKINEMATENIFMLNREFGDIQDVALLKGFWFNSVEPDQNTNYQYMFKPWREYMNNPAIPVIGYILFIVVLFGFVQALLSKDRTKITFATLFLFAFTMLATATIPFSWIDIFVRDYIPLFGQAFRFPFTKFSLLAGLLYGILFANGIQALVALSQERIRKMLSLAAVLIGTTLIVVFSLPVFYGELFYSREQVAIPKEYQELFSFFSKQDPNTRIANFPQPNFWAWEYYKWPASSADGPAANETQGGVYGGSGFLWYGIKQPILDRAFDVWSETSENYYFEVSQAIYTNKPQQLADVLAKYQVSWILIDKNIVNPVSPTSVFTTQLEEELQQIPTVKKEISFGQLDVYKVTPKEPIKNFIFAVDHLPTTNSYAWEENDKMYTSFGNYAVSKNLNNTPEYQYPFRSLFSLKSQKELPYVLKEYPRYLELTAKKPILPGGKLKLPSYSATETIIPAEIVTQVHEKTFEIGLTIQTPEVFVDGKKVAGDNLYQELFTLPITNTTKEPFKLDINGTAKLSLPLKTQNEAGSTFLSMTQDNIITLTDQSGTKTVIAPASAFQTLDLLQAKSIALHNTKTAIVSVKIPKITNAKISLSEQAADYQDKVTSCNRYRTGKAVGNVITENGQDALQLEAENAYACLSLYTTKLPHNLGYAFLIESKNDDGRGLHVWLENIDQKHVPLDTYLEKNKTYQTNTFLLAPQDEFGSAYALHLESVSVGDEQTVNSIRTIKAYPIPYTYLTDLVVADKNASLEPTRKSIGLVSDHPNESLYTVNLSSLSQNQPATIVLSQSYDLGWKAYLVSSPTLLTEAFPFFFGSELKNHVMVNNWENGWTLPLSLNSSPSSTLVIVYLPQYLEYLGFGLVILTLLTLGIRAATQGRDVPKT